MTNGSPAVHDPATEQIYAGSRVSIRLNSSTQVAELWLQRTDRHNAIDAEFVDQLDIAVSALNMKPDKRGRSSSWRVAPTSLSVAT